MRDRGWPAKITVDGTDCEIQEPTPFNKKWYSHKFRDPGLRYEIALCIQTGWIVWLNGPFPCGRYPDLTIAREGLVHELDDGEKCVADGGYQDGRVYADTPTGLNTWTEKKKRNFRARHETVNARVKIFGIFNQVFRHPVCKHGLCFHTAINLTQISIEHGEPLFDVSLNFNY